MISELIKSLCLSLMLAVSISHARSEDSYGHTFSCDANGNMTSDLNRGITSMTYDINNRPREITFSSGATTGYIYSADGVKLQTFHRTPAISPAAVTEEMPEEEL